MKPVTRVPFQNSSASAALQMHGDSGLQPERTVLSWNRTAMSLFLVALLTTRWFGDYAVVAICVATLVLTAGAWALSVQSRRYRRQSSGLQSESIHPARVDILVMSLVACTAPLIAAAGMTGNHI